MSDAGVFLIGALVLLSVVTGLIAMGWVLRGQDNKERVRSLFVRVHEQADELAVKQRLIDALSERLTEVDPVGTQRLLDAVVGAPEGRHGRG